MPIRLTFFDVVLFSAMIVFFVIGIHQSIYYGVAMSYWLFMLSTLAFLLLNKRLKAKRQTTEEQKPDAVKAVKKPKNKKK
jgi:hypothetical protein